MAQAEAPRAFQTTLDGQQPDRPTPEGMLQIGYRFCLCM